MPETLRDKLEAGPMYDGAIVEHHFTPYMRDYDILVDVASAVPDGSRSYIAVRYLFRFTHCVLAHITTRVSDEAWRTSWSDEYTDYKMWEKAETPPGYVWGVCRSEVYPGLTYVEDSELGREWSQRLRHAMHEVMIETNSQRVNLIFHDVIIKEVALGDPDTNELRPVVPR